MFMCVVDTATTDIYTLSLHDALPIFDVRLDPGPEAQRRGEPPAADPLPHHVHHDRADPRSERRRLAEPGQAAQGSDRSEEHTSELQSLAYLVCRLLLEKKKTHT